MNMARSPCVPAGSSSQPTEWHNTPISGDTREKFKLGFLLIPIGTSALRHRIEVLIAEVAGHDGDRDGKLARILDERGHERTRPFLSGPGSQHQEAGWGHPPGRGEAEPAGDDHGRPPVETARSHEPEHDDGAMDALHAAARRAAQQRGTTEEVIVAQEGMRLSL